MICEIAPARDDQAAIISLMERHGYQPHSISDDGDVTPMGLPEDTGTPGLAHATADPWLFYNVCFKAC